jgi:hypothetical protein
MDAIYAAVTSRLGDSELLETAETANRIWRNWD